MEADIWTLLCLWCHSQTIDANGDRLFIDPAQVVSITFGNLEIPVEH